MYVRAMSRRIGGAVLASVLGLALFGCDTLRAPPVPDWPGPHAPYPFPDDVPHRTQ